MSNTELNSLLSSITEADLKETIEYTESEHDASTYYVDELNNGKYLVSKDETYLSIHESAEEAIEVMYKLSKKNR